MTERAEIERLLNETGFTLEGLPELYSMKQCEDAIIRSGLAVGMAGNMICHQSDVIERLVNALRSALDLAPKWISVKDRLPEIGDSYLVTVKEKYDYEAEWRYHVDVAGSHGEYIDGFWDTFNDWNEGQEVHVTHWMPLPEPPKEE